MPNVECFQIPGLHLFFWSQDHDPPHFHVKRPGEWEVRVVFAEDASRMFEVKWGAGPDSKTRRRIARLVEAHRLQLMAEWETKVNR